MFEWGVESKITKKIIWFFNTGIKSTSMQIFSGPVGYNLLFLHVGKSKPREAVAQSYVDEV